MTTVLGIDPGLSSTGWGIIDVQTVQDKLPCAKYTFIDCGILKTDTNDDLVDRLAFIYDSIYKLIKTTKPDKISIERVFVNVNPASSEKLIMARTVAILAIAKTGHKYVEFAPNMVKKVITGMGHGSKELVKEMVWKMLQFNISNCYYPKTADASDALAIALCAVMAERDNYNDR
jgi:crossover junction endodeoxyribonuclease RuvC